MENENIKYRDRGLILIGIGLLLSLLLLIPRFGSSYLGSAIIIILILGIVGPSILIPTGVGFLYKSLSDRYQGVFILCFGAFFYSISMFIIFGIPFQTDSFAVILLLDTLFFSTSFFIPGLIKIIKDTQVEDIYAITYSVLPITILGLLIYAIIVVVLNPLNFLYFFNEGLIYAFPLSLLIAHIAFCLVWSELDIY